MPAAALGANDLVVGQLTWIGLPFLQTSIAFFVVILLFGAVDSPLAPLAIFAATLTGIAIAAPVAAWTATRENDYALSSILRFAIMPMFLFSGTFFPVSQLPDALEKIAYLTPLWHGVYLCRSLTLGEIDPLGMLGSVVYLTALAAVGTLVARVTFRRALVK